MLLLVGRKLHIMQCFTLLGDALKHDSVIYLHNKNEQLKSNAMKIIPSNKGMFVLSIVNMLALGFVAVLLVLA